jgi:hypothetical protein
MPYPKSSSEAYGIKSNIVRPLGSDEGIKKYEYPTSSTHYNYNRNLTNSREDNKYESSNNTISDNEIGSCNSYTYSKGSSALAGFNRMDNSAHNNH